MVTTKEIPVEYTEQEMRRESKYVITHHQLNTKEDSEVEKEGQNSYKVYRKQPDGNSNYFPISHYVEGIKLLNQKTQTGRLTDGLFKRGSNNLLCTRESF